MVLAVVSPRRTSRGPPQPSKAEIPSPMATMTSLQIQSFASLIDQLPVGVEESERIDRAANAACSSGSEDGSAERAREIADGKTPGPRHDCQKGTCQECRQPVGSVACVTDETLSCGHAYGCSGTFNGIPFPSMGNDAACLQIPEQPSTHLATGGCGAVQSGIADGSFTAVASAISRDPTAQQQPTAGLRGFPSQATCAVVEPMHGFLAFGPEEASAGFTTTVTPQEYNTPDISAASAHCGARNVFPGEQSCVGPVWQSWGQGCTSAPANSPNRPCGERLSGQPQQSARPAQPAQVTPAVYGGGQVQVSIVSPGKAVVSASV